MVRSLTRMTIQIPPRIASFNRIEFATDHHPEFDRAVTLPRNAPNEWAVDAYLLSIGREPLHEDDYRDYEDDEFERPFLTPWRSDRRRVELPELAHRVNVVLREADAPPVGAPLVSVSALTHAEVDGEWGDWLTAAPPFRSDDVNRELVQRFGVVTPHFDELDDVALDPAIRRTSRIGGLLRALTPVRRLALLAHIDAAGLLRAHTPDLTAVESALAPLRLLLDHLGPNGRTQDPATGWIPDREVQKLSRSLGWSSGSSLPAPEGAALVAFARRGKLIRRLKGRVVVTSLGRQLVQPTTRTLKVLSGLILESTRKYSLWGSPCRAVDSSLALLAIADGAAKRLDELADHVSLGARALDESESLNDDARWQRISSAVTGAPRESERSQLQQIAESLGALSLSNEFGVITPAMREVARWALTE